MGAFSSKVKKKSILLCASLPPEQGVEYVFLLLKHTANGPKIHKIFHRHPLPDINPGEPSCTLVGSSLYAFCRNGGVHRLDTLNPADGWKTSNASLPSSACTNTTVQVLGNLIFMFPRARSHVPRVETYPGIQNRWGYAFDTTEEKCYPIQSPTSDIPALLGFTDCCGGLDQRGILVTVLDKLYLYDVKQKSWVFWDDYIPYPRYTYYSAHLNGIFYFCNPCSYVGCWFMRVYDARRCRSFEIKLPISDMLRCSLYVVPVADFELCFFWYKKSDEYNPESCLTYCKIKVLDDPSPSAILLERESFYNLDLNGLVHGLPIDSVSDQDLEEISVPNSPNLELLEMDEDSLLPHKALLKNKYSFYQKDQSMIDSVPRQSNFRPSSYNFSVRNSFPFSNCAALSSSFPTSDVLNKSNPKNCRSVANMCSGSDLLKYKGYMTRGIRFFQMLVK